MFEASTRRRFPLFAPVVALALAAAGVWVARAPLANWLGGTPTFPVPHVDQIYPESPLAVELRLEAALGRVDADPALAFADGVAADLASWLAGAAGTRDLEAAERDLWATDRTDLLVLRWATLMRDREVYARKAGHLAFDLPTEGPKYVYPDELGLVLAHVAWRLDLAIDLVRSPIHDYLEWREPGGSRVRGIEPTAFRQVDAVGQAAHTNEISVGYKLTFDKDHFRGGSGGIANPDPLPPGAYQVVTPDELPGELLARLSSRYDVDPAKLEAGLGANRDPAAAQAAFHLRLTHAMRAWLAGATAEVAAEAKALAALRASYDAVLPKAPDERAFSAAAAHDRGDRRAERADVAAVLDWYEDKLGSAERVRSDAEAVALWLDLADHAPTQTSWNTRIVPLMNRFRADSDRMPMLCASGRRALADTVQKIQDLAPWCAGI